MWVVLSLGKHSAGAHAWAPAGIFPEGGKTAWTDQTDLFFGAPKARTKIFVIFSALKGFLCERRRRERKL